MIRMYTLKTPGSDLIWKGSHLAKPIFGSDPTRKRGQTDPESESEIYFLLRFRVSLTQKWVWPNGTLSESNLTRECLECMDCKRNCNRNGNRKPGQTEPESESERHFLLRCRVSLTQTPDQSDPEMGPFPGQI